MRDKRGILLLKSHWDNQKTGHRCEGPTFWYTVRSRSRPEPLYMSYMRFIDKNNSLPCLKSLKYTYITVNFPAISIVISVLKPSAILTNSCEGNSFGLVYSQQTCWASQHAQVLLCPLDLPLMQRSICTSSSYSAKEWMLLHWNGIVPTRWYLSPRGIHNRLLQKTSAFTSVLSSWCMWPFAASELN